MPTLTMTKGLPASGKTTWAKQQKAKRVNKDDLRAMIDNGVWSKYNEKDILGIRDYIIARYLEKNYDVVVDDTNLAPKHEESLRALAFDLNAKFEIKDFTGVPLEECIKRDQKRPNYVGEKVIKTMYNSFLAKKANVAQYLPDPNLPKAIICDIDGTLAHMSDRSPYDWSRVGEDTLDKAVASILDGVAGDVEIILVSGRDESCRKTTQEWLEWNTVSYDHLYMRPEADNRKDVVIKQEIFDEHIRDRYNVLYVLDDRNQVVEMWRNMGLKVLQVADGDF